MRIEAVEAVGVGPLRERILELAPGLTVVHGPNEAGKSCWHAALLCGWLGLRRGPGAQRAGDRELVERFAPWSGDPLIAAVRVVTDDGLRFRFRHNLTDLADHEVTDGTGAVVTGRFEHDGTADGARLLGLTRDVARVTLCVSQAEVLAVADAADGLQTQLQRAAATADRDGGTAAAALGRLENFRREHVGSERVNATKPLRRALDACEETRRRLEQAEEEHEAHLALTARRDEAAAEAARLEAEHRELDRAVRAAEVAERRRELAELRDLHAQVTEDATAPPPADDAACAEVDRARQRFAERPGPVEADDGGVARLEAELAALPPPPEGDLEADPGVVAARDELRSRRERLDDHRRRRPDPGGRPDLGGLTPEDLERHAVVLETPLPAPPAPARSPADDDPGGPGTPDGRPSRLPGVLAVVGAVLAAAGLVALVAGPSAPGVLALLAGAGAGASAVALRRRERAAREAGVTASATRELERAREVALHAERQRVTARRQQAHEALAAAGLAVDEPDRLRALAERARTAEREARALAEWEADLDRHEAEAARAARRLAEALAARGAPVEDDPDAACTAYERACRERREQAVRAARREDLEQQLAGARRLAEDRRERTRRRERAAEELVALARRHGFDGEAAQDADRFLADWREEQRRLAAQRSALERARERLEGRLAGRSLEELTAEVEELAATVGDAPPASDPPAARRRLAEVERALERAWADAARLDGEVGRAERQLIPVAEAREAHEQARAELARARELERVLDATVAHLRDASHRVNQDIAPVLRDAVEAHLPTLTRGRYTDVQVDPRTLEVTVRTDGGAYRPARQLSQGTAEQVYLLLRIGLAEHLVVSDETAPLLLDDVTVQCDEHRTVAFLELCRRLAEGRQIVLLSQEREVLDWAEDTLDGRHALRRLPDPAGRMAPVPEPEG